MGFFHLRDETCKVILPVTSMSAKLTESGHKVTNWGVNWLKMKVHSLASSLHLWKETQLHDKKLFPPLFQNGFIWQTFLPYFVLILLNVSHGRIYVSDSQVLHSTRRRNDFHFHNSEFCICFWAIFFAISCLLEWFEFSQIEKAYQCLTLWYI